MIDWAFNAFSGYIANVSPVSFIFAVGDLIVSTAFSIAFGRVIKMRAWGRKT